MNNRLLVAAFVALLPLAPAVQAQDSTSRAGGHFVTTPGTRGNPLGSDFGCSRWRADRALVAALGRAIGRHKRSGQQLPTGSHHARRLSTLR